MFLKIAVMTFLCWTSLWRKRFCFLERWWFPGAFFPLSTIPWGNLVFFFLLFLLSWILVQCFLSLCLKLDLGNITLQDILITQVLWSGWDTGYIKISWKLWHMGTRNQRVQNHPLYCLNSMGRKFRDHKISRRSFGRFCRSPNSLLMGFTFLMDANTSKYFYNYFIKEWNKL